MIKMIVFTDGDVTFDYNEVGKKKLDDKENFLESFFGTMPDEEALAKTREVYPELSDEEIIGILQSTVFPNAYKEIIPGFMKAISVKYPHIRIGIATEHTRYVESYLKEYADDYFISNEIGCSKGDVRYFQTIVERSGLNPADILYVDYDERNVEMAKSCGISAITVPVKGLELMKNVERVELGHRLIDAIKVIKK